MCRTNVMQQFEEARNLPARLIWMCLCQSLNEIPCRPIRHFLLVRRNTFCVISALLCRVSFLRKCTRQQVEALEVASVFEPLLSFGALPSCCISILLASPLHDACVMQDAENDSRCVSYSRARIRKRLWRCTSSWSRGWFVRETSS